MTRVATVGHCQSKSLADCFSVLLGGRPVDYFRQERVKAGIDDAGEILKTNDVVFVMNGGPAAVLQKAATKTNAACRIFRTPRIFFSGFHPDVIYPTKSSAERKNPLGNANSSILLSAWRSGLSAGDALQLFNQRVFEHLGFYDFYSEAQLVLDTELRDVGLDRALSVARWASSGPFMYQPLHPHLRILSDLSVELFKEAGIALHDCDPALTLADELSHNAVWPVYSEVARHLNFEGGGYLFRRKNTQRSDHENFAPMDLAEFVAQSYTVFEKTPPQFDAFERLKDPRYDDLSIYLNTKMTAASKVEVPRNPYRELPPSNFWSRAVAKPQIADVDPIVKPKFKIATRDAIATAGSCFAQHISRTLKESGYHYLITENPPDGARSMASDNYGVFSARYGNVYTARQLVQLVARAYGDFKPVEDCWTHADGYFIDPFRPKIKAMGFNSIADLYNARDVHFKSVRTMLEGLNVFVFTLGLTEAWRSRNDHAVVPLAPGVAGAATDALAYEPINFDVDSIREDLDHFVHRLKGINPSAKVLLTVSPVPLIATFEDQHVLSATTYSKAVLRVAAADCVKKHAHVDYFPSFEIITGNYNRGRYYEDDLREVTAEGVAHVMRLFMKHYTDGVRSSDRPTTAMAEAGLGMQIICDEEHVVEGL